MKIDEVQSGDVLAWSSNSKVSYLKLCEGIIRFFTMSEFCHVGVALRINDKLYVLEAVEPEVSLTDITDTNDFYCIPMNIMWTDGYEVLLKEHLGNTYSIMDAIRGYLGKPSTNNNRWQCAELVNDFYKKIGIDLGNSYTPSKLIKEVMSVTGNSLVYIK